MTRRTLSVLLALCMLMGLLPFGAFAAQEDFSDVPADAWYAADVAYAAEHGLMNGVGDGKFDPDGTTTRAMLVTILHRLEGTPAAARSAFSDVPAGAWYAAAVDWAAAHKIVEGMDAATFAPTSPVTREQLAVILYRYANFKGMGTAQKAELSAYSDAASVSAWSADAMAWANAAGLVNGVSKTQLDPQGSAARAQAAAILARFDRMVKAAEAKPGTVTLKVNKTEATVTEPRQTFTGAYTVENDQIDRVDWVQHSDVEAYEGTTGTAMIDQTKGTWEAAEILLAPGANTITFTAYTKNGATAEQTVEITYDSGEIADYTNSDITYTDDQGNGYVNNVILVVLDVEASEAEKEAAIQAVCKAVGGEVIGQLNGCCMYQIQVPKSDLEALEALCRAAEGASALVLSANLDYYYAAPETPKTVESSNVRPAQSDGASVLWAPAIAPYYPNDPWNDASWDENNPAGDNWWAEAIHAPSAWAYSQYFQYRVPIGICDSGIDKTNVDLSGVSITTLGGNNNAGPHGTHVAGLICATHDNNAGMTGMCWSNQVYNYDVYEGKIPEDTNGFYSSAITYGTQLLAAAGCKVLNFSNGSMIDYPWERKDSDVSTAVNTYGNLMKNYDFLVCQAAGNGYEEDYNETYHFRDYGFEAQYNGQYASISASNNLKNRILVVAAAQNKDLNDPSLEHADEYQLIRWSNFGSYVDIAVPGVDIYSTYYSKYAADDHFASMSGTSMATPITAGLAGMIWSVNPNFSAADVKEIIVSSANQTCYRNSKNVEQLSVRYNNRTYYYGLDNRETYPMMNAQAAVEEALERTYGDGTLSVSFVNAKDNQPVNNVSYEIRLGSPTGTVVASGTASGSASITLPRAQGTDYHQAQYYLVATGNFTDYTSTAFTIDVGGTTSLTAALNVPEAPQAQSLRIVLTWNAEPADLDAHLFGEGGHVYYKQHSINHARMDLDDTQSFGPETITVDDVTALGDFTYAVHNFTDRAQFDSAAGLAGSGATVRVYSGSTLLKTYTVPTNMLGTVWNVFSVSADGTITDGGMTEQYFAYSGNGEAIPGLFTSGAAPQSAAWQTVAPKKQ